MPPSKRSSRRGSAAAEATEAGAAPEGVRRSSRAKPTPPLDKESDMKEKKVKLASADVKPNAKKAKKKGKFALSAGKQIIKIVQKGNILRITIKKQKTAPKKKTTSKKANATEAKQSHGNGSSAKAKAKPQEDMDAGAARRSRRRSSEPTSEPPQPDAQPATVEATAEAKAEPPAEDTAPQPDGEGAEKPGADNAMEVDGPQLVPKAEDHVLQARISTNDADLAMVDASPPDASGEEEEAIDDGTSQLESPDESVANDWTKEETSALVEFVSKNGLSAWSKLSEDPVLKERHSNGEMAEKRFNLLFGLASGTIRPDESFNVIQQPGVAQFTNPYVREYMSRYYPHHMNQLRMQYQQYAYQYARQMVRRPAYYQPGMMQQTRQPYERDSFEGEEQPSEEYVSELTGSSDTSSSDDEIKYDESSSEEQHGDDDDDSRRRRKKTKAGRQRKNQDKFVKNERPAGARSSGRLRGETRKSYTFDEYEYIDDEVQSDAESEPDERIDRVLAVRDAQDHKHRIEHEQELEQQQQHKKRGARKPAEMKRRKDADGGEEQQFYIKTEGSSYVHCEWLTLAEIEERFLRPGVEKVKRWIKKREEVEAENNALWGGEPFNPNFTEVEKVIASQWIVHPPDDPLRRKVEMFLVKWKDLSYAEATWETREDVNDVEKIEEFERNNKIPDEDEDKPVEATPARIAEWHDASPVYKNDNRLRDYQLQGLNWLVKSYHLNRNTILADEMGLGKTIQSIAFLYHLFDVEKIRGPFMVVVPLSTIGHWQREFSEWTDLNVVMYHDNFRGKVTRALIRQHEFFYAGTERVKFHVLLTTYETVLSDVAELAPIHWRQLIIDEGHRLKNRNARLLWALQQLQGPPTVEADGSRTRQPPRRVLLTGTPIQNSTEELWTLLNYIAPYEFYSIDVFMQRFGDLKDGKQVEELQDVIRQYVLRRMKEHVEKSIPPKEETIIDIELTTLQKTYYRAIYEKNRDFLARGVSKSNVPRLINVEMELRKCCNHPWLIKGVEDKEVREDAPSDYYIEKTIAASGKMVLLDKLLTKLHKEGHRVLIFSQMCAVLDILEFYIDYRGYPYERLDGHTHGNTRQAAIDRFCAEGSDRFVFLLSTRAGGIGLNLVAADTVIIYDSDWNPQQDVQAQARVHRIGQQRSVSVYRLVTRNTYEAEMFERASKKLGLDQAVLTSMQTESAESGMDDADKKDLERLLRRGAYGVLTDDDSAARQFCESNVEDILARNSRVVVHKGEKTKSGALQSLQYQKMSFQSAAADSNIDINDPNFWEKVLARERRPGEESAAELRKMFEDALDLAEGRTPEEPTDAKDDEQEPPPQDSAAAVPVQDEQEQPEPAAQEDTQPQPQEEGQAEQEPAATTEAAEQESAPAKEVVAPKGREARKAAAAARAKARAEAKAAAAEARKAAKKKREEERKRKEEESALLNFRNAKSRKTFLDALRSKVQRTISAKHAGEHIADLAELLELLERVATMEKFFSKKQREDALAWKHELERRGRRRTTNGGGGGDGGIDSIFGGTMPAEDDEFSLAEDDDEDERPARRAIKRRAPTKAKTKAKAKTKSKAKATRKRGRGKAAASTSVLRVRFLLDGEEVLLVDQLKLTAPAAKRKRQRRRQKRDEDDEDDGDEQEEEEEEKPEADEDVDEDEVVAMEDDSD